jgi:23S rRNA (adenine2503-C2)-methyltransferase
MNTHHPSKTNLLSLSLNELRRFLTESGISVNIDESLYKDLHKRHIQSIARLNISKKWKTILYHIAYIPRLEMKEMVISAKGDTIKYLFRLPDGEFIESVLLFIDDKVTLCISSQVGCKLGCRFCATGLMGFRRNLEVWEMLQQVYSIGTDIKIPINNIVYMGMGEPMLNYGRVISSAHILNSNIGMNIASQRISISTVGITPMIHRFIEDREPFHLILSLHSVIQKKRERLIPVAKRYPIEGLIDMVKLYFNRRRDWVTIAYIMIKDVNMGREDIESLKSVLRGLKVKLNLIPYNGIDGIEYESPGHEEVMRFYEAFLDLDSPVNIRKTQGQDIEGACGQLIVKEGHYRNGG